MANSVETALDLLTGRWRSQILHAGVSLGIIDQLARGQQSANTVAAALLLNAENAYRLMRALASIDILVESASREFTLTEAGELFLSDHPNSMRGACLWEEGLPMYNAWKHLPDVVREGGNDGFKREYGVPIFDMIMSDPKVGALFNNAMTSYSQRETDDILVALKNADLSGLKQICDIGGGQGHLLCSVLQNYDHLSGTVFELPATLESPETLLASSMNLADRCGYHGGDMFKEVPEADAYLLKHILHDWNDAECVQILGNAHRASAASARILVAEYVVPGPEQSDFSKLFDVHMMTVLTGKERTEEEFAELFDNAGWVHAQTWRPPQGSLAVVEGVKK